MQTARPAREGRIPDVSPSWSWLLSAVDDGHVRLVVALTGGRGEIVQTFDLIGAVLDAVGSRVLFDSGDALRAGDRGDVVALREQPGQRNLRRRGVDLGRDGRRRARSLSPSGSRRYLLTVERARPSRSAISSLPSPRPASASIASACCLRVGCSSSSAGTR
jgi:hypothetical protein